MKRSSMALALAAAAALAAPAVARAQDSFTIGVHASFSGAAAAFAEGMLAATEFAADDVNKDGGLEVAGRRYKVLIKQYDDRYKAQDAVTAMDRLMIQDGIRFVVGPLGSAAAVATKAQTTGGKVITMTLGFTPRALGPDAPYAFRTVITTGEFSEPQVAWLLKNTPAKRVVSLLPNDETGQQMGAGNTAAYAKAGSKLQVDYFERERVDFVPILTRILASADALEIGGAAPTTAGLILKQARELGYKGPVFVTGGDVTAELVKVAGKEAAEGAYVHLPIDTSLPATAAYIARYKAKYGPNMNGFSPFFYSGLQMLFAAMQKAGTVEDTTKIADALGALKDFPTALGPASWTGKVRYGIDHQIDLPFYIGQIRDGVAVKVATCDVNSCR
ncbi:ABC transporter substrate-binding protein [Aquabacter sp. CN5-332]|uniref:ABC transporter substrate-binding protein n=1 Tax=Aquabacter sp. CN5-332 TaxID=3156608 RepID=UPI0032B3D153